MWHPPHPKGLPAGKSSLRSERGVQLFCRGCSLILDVRVNRFEISSNWTTKISGVPKMSFRISFSQIFVHPKKQIRRQTFNYLNHFWIAHRPRTVDDHVNMIALHIDYLDFYSVPSTRFFNRNLAENLEPFFLHHFASICQDFLNLEHAQESLILDVSSLSARASYSLRQSSGCVCISFFYLREIVKNTGDDLAVKWREQQLALPVLYFL